MSKIIQIDDVVDQQKFGLFNLSLLFWSFLAMVSDGYQVTVTSFAAKQITAEWHVSPLALGHAFSASLFGVLVGAPLLGMIGDRQGRKLAIILSVLLYGLATFSIVWSANIGQIELLLFLNGIGLGGLMPNNVALSSELSPKRLRAALVILMFMGITVGSIIPGTLGLWLQAHYGWRALFAFGGAAAVAISIGLMIMLPESVRFLAMRPDRRAQLIHNLRRIRPDLAIDEGTRLVARHMQRAAGIGLKQIFGDRLWAITALLWICFIANLLVNYFLNSWMPLLFENAGLTAANAALISVCYQIGGTMGGIAASIFLQRMGYGLVALMFSIAAPAILLFGMPGLSFGVLAPIAMVIGFCVLGGQFGSNATAGLLYATSFRSKGVGWALAVGRIGSIAGPIIGGALIARHLPLQQLFFVPAVSMACGASAAFVIARLCYKRFQGFRIEDIADNAAPNPD